ncbi:MAG TPA: hypothetical protein VLJ13_10010 [Brevundimonas sp.]|nr:hypothetical protein [Brevundimonas sp.]
MKIASRVADIVIDDTPRAAARCLTNPSMTLIQALRAEDAFRDFRI